VDTAVRTTQRLAEANEWSLVLNAAALPFRLQALHGEWHLFVDDDHADAARAMLDAYDAERQPAPAITPTSAPAADFAWTTGLVAGVALLGFFALAGPARVRSEWFRRGAGSAGLMWQGEPWRAVTALTLHVDAVHVLGNSVATALLLAALVARLGPGVGLALFVLTGALANLIAAAAHGGGHVAVGASTATFGALGLLAAIQFWRPSPWITMTRSRRWTIPVATLLLLAMLGASANADVLAHGAGVATGVVVGAMTALRRRGPPGPLTQIACGLGTIAVVVLAWVLAFARA
jgi:membrane associated rhomboid family serine protease